MRSPVQYRGGPGAGARGAPGTAGAAAALRGRSRAPCGMCGRRCCGGTCGGRSAVPPSLGASGSGCSAHLSGLPAPPLPAARDPAGSRIPSRSPIPGPPALRRGRGAQRAGAAGPGAARIPPSSAGPGPRLPRPPAPRAAPNSSQVSADTAASRNGSSLLLALMHSAALSLLPHASSSCLLLPPPLLLPGRAKTDSGDAAAGLRRSDISPAAAAQRPAPFPAVLREESCRASSYLGLLDFID